MARIQWTPIVAPDVSEGAVRAQQLAGSALQSAFGGFTSLLDQFENSRREANLAELFTRQNAFAAGNDVAGYTADLADGDLMRGLSFLKPQDIAAARGFTNELRTGRNADVSFEREGVRWDRETNTYNRTELERTTGQAIARELLPLRMEAERTGDRRAYDTAMAGILERNPGATVSQIEGMLQGGQEAVRGYRGNVEFERGTERYGRETTQWGWTVEDRNTEREAEALALKFQEYGPNTTVDDLIGSQEYQQSSPRVRARALALAGLPDASSVGGGVPVSGAFAGDATNAMAVLNYNARDGGFSSVPDNIETYGQLDSFGTQMLRTRGVTSSASGPFQITRDTRREFGPRVFGANWRDMPATMENDDRIAQAIFEDAKRRGPAAISGRWAAIDAREAAQLARMPWSQAREIIAQQEGGVRITAGQARGQGQTLQVGASVATGTDRFGPLARNVIPLMNDDRDNITVARELTSAESGKFSGLNAREVAVRIRTIQDMYEEQSGGGRLSAAAAGQILANNMDPYTVGDFFGGFVGRRGSISGGNGWFPNQSIDIEGVRQDLGQLRPQPIRNAQGQVVRGPNGQVQTEIPLATSYRNQSNREGIIAGAEQGVAALAAAEAALAQQEEIDRRRGIANNPATLRMRRDYLRLQEQWGQYVPGAVATLQAGGQFTAPAPPPPRPIARGPQGDVRPRRTPTVVYGD